MRSTLFPAIALGLIAPAFSVTPAWAQDSADTIIVTGSRVERDDYDSYYDDEQSAIGLVRRADYFVKPIYIESDSRDATLRRAEVSAMLNSVIDGAARENISLVYGRYSLKPLTAENVADVSFGRGTRPDTTRVGIYARIPLGNSGRRASEVDAQIEAFAKSVPVTGRSYITTGSTNLAINNPQQYRRQVVRAIADEANSYAAMFGNGYGVEIRGLDSELYFKQNSETEVFLYIEHNFVIRPK